MQSRDHKDAVEDVSDLFLALEYFGGEEDGGRDHDFKRIGAVGALVVGGVEMEVEGNGSLDGWLGQLEEVAYFWDESGLR